MQDQRSHRHVPLSVVAGFSALMLATGSAVAWWSWTSASRNAPVSNPGQPTQQHAQPNNSEGQNTPPIAAPNATTQKPEAKPLPAVSEKTLQVYWLKGSGSKIELVPSPVKLSSTGGSETSLKAALDQLMARPSNAAITTTIPQGTQVHSVTVQEDGIHVDLSQAFTTGGGSASMTARVAQVLYTATSLDPSGKVWLSVEGKPLETLGGEGLVLDQPMTRESFNRDFSL